MPYTVQFVGLVCFYRDNGTRHVFLPDGRSPGTGIEPHYASIRVAIDDVLDTGGWNGSVNGPSVTFELPPCSIELDAASAPGLLDTSQHDNRLPQLRQIDPNFEIDPAQVQTIARLHVQQGVLKAYRIPGGTAAITQLDVPHDGDVHVRVRPQDGAERVLRFRPGTEVVIANMAQSGYLGAPTYNNHFKIYEKLSTRAVSLHEPESVPEVPPSLSRHVTFTQRDPIGLSTDCTNTGCC
jgi:hypothetical protein